MRVHLKRRMVLLSGLLAGVSLLLLLTAALSRSEPQTAELPTFSRDIAPIIYTNCVPCHHASDRGEHSRAFALSSYEQVKEHRDAIVSATESRRMPPWLPEAGYGDFADDRCWLSEIQIQLIKTWARARRARRPAGRCATSTAVFRRLQLGKPDLVIEATREVSIPASGPDVFWNFVFSPDIKTVRYVRAIEINPGSGVDLVHHANVILDPARTGRRQESSPGAGFPGMDLMLAHSPLEVPSHFLFWKPGARPWIEPDGLAWKLKPGTDLVLNAHFMPMGMSMAVKPSIGLYFTDKPPTRLPILVELENDEALDIPAGARAFTVTDEFRLPVDVDLLAVYPHAHYLGHVLEGYATLPDGRREWLVRIPDWNPDWQAVFHYQKPVVLPKGTVLRMRYSFDNSAANPRNPHSPPERVVGGNQATDEMAHLWLQLVPRGSPDERLQIEAALLEHRVEKYPRDFQSRLALGALLLARLDPAGAAKVLEQAVRIDPGQEEARRYLGMSLEALGRRADATEQLRIAVRLDPDDTQARYNLARLLVKSGKIEEAVAIFRSIVREAPNNAQYHDELGELLLRQNEPALAIDEFNAALALDPSLASALEDRLKAQAMVDAPSQAQ